MTPPVTGTVRAFASCLLVTVALLARGGLRLSNDRVGGWIAFADGSRSQVFRETVREGPLTRDPAFLVVGFRLRLVGRSRLLHTLFRVESIANTLLFAGFPGFRSKLWLTDERTGTYRGIYEWDGPERARHYANTLSALLRPLCERGSVAFHVVPGVRREEGLHDPALLVSTGPAPPDAWWLPQEAP